MPVAITATQCCSVGTSISTVAPMRVNEDTSASRIVAVLEALAQPFEGHPDGLSVSELARTINRDKSSVSRQLKSLIELGVVEKNENGKHVLGWRVFTIAARAGDQRLLLFAPAVMRQLGRQASERVHLSIRRQDEVLTILTEGPMHAVGAVGWVGRTVPILGTASGRALMIDDSEEEIRTVFAQTPRVLGGSNLPTTADETVARVFHARAKGIAVIADEHEEGLSAVGAPIRDVHGRIIAAINISAQSFRIADRLDEFSRLIHRAALYLSKTISAPAPAKQESNVPFAHEGLGSPQPEKRQVP